jgi:hypothetical protein
VPDRERITIERWSRRRSQPHPFEQVASVIPVAAKNRSSPPPSIGVEHPIEVETVGEQRRAFLVVARVQLALHRATHALERGRRPTPSGVPPIPMRRSTSVRDRGDDRARDVAVGDRNTCPGGADLRDHVCVPRAVEDRHRHLLGALALRLGDLLDVLRDRRVDVDRVGGLGAGGDLPCRARRREEHRAARGKGDHRQRVGLADAREGRRRSGRRRRRPLAAPLLAVEEHGRLVLLAFADHDDAVHRDGVDHEAHRVHGRRVGGDLVAATHPAPGRERGRFGDADEFHGQVAVGKLSHRRTSRMSRGSAPSDSTRWMAAWYGRSSARVPANRATSSRVDPSTVRPRASRSRRSRRAVRPRR